jgi:type III secretion protein Q
MTESTSSPAPDIAPAVEPAGHGVVVDELELPVQLVADTVALTVSELSSLGPGYVIELPTPVTDLTVKLVVHGQVIGQGELVTIGDHVGIRILHMAHEHVSVQ